MQTTPWGQTSDVNRKPLSLCPFVAGLKKIALKSDFIYIFLFMFHHMYIAPGRGRQSIGDKILMTTERPFLFAHMLQVSKWSLRNLILYTFLMILYMYIAPGQGHTTPWGQIWCQQKALITSTICCKFQTNLFEFRFYTHFLLFFYMYIAPGAGVENPLWTKFWCQQKSLVTLPICCKFQKNIFEVWFYT